VGHSFYSRQSRLSGSPANRLNNEADMSAFNRFATLLGLVLVAAHAQAVDFSFTSGVVSAAAFGNRYTTSVNDVSLTASAWSSAGRANRFATAALTLTPGVGLEVCSSQEGLNCTGSGFADALGNQNKKADDLILFTFSQAFTLQSLTLQQFGGDSDLSLWARKLGGVSTFYNNTSSVNDIKIVSLAAYTGSYDWLAIAASSINRDKFKDFAKLQSLTINPVTQPVPEAATWMTMLAGLGLVCFRVSRRMQA
jgi:hypothetical protein